MFCLGRQFAEKKLTKNFGDFADEFFSSFLVESGSDVATNDIADLLNDTGNVLILFCLNA